MLVLLAVLLLLLLVVMVFLVVLVRLVASSSSSTRPAVGFVFVHRVFVPLLLKVVRSLRRRRRKQLGNVRSVRLRGCERTD